MKPSELYEMDPIRETKDIESLEGHVEVNMMDIDDEKNERVSLRYYADPYIDGYRIWQLFSVWFDDRPVMICQRAGRSGRDHGDTFVTDNQAFREMNEYLFSIREDYVDEEDIYDPDQDIENLTDFYGSTLEHARFSDRIQKDRQTTIPGVDNEVSETE